jgi:chromosome partitioning protein
MFDGRTRLSAQVADEVRAHFGDKVLATAIPRSVRVSEAPSFGQTVLTYDPGSTGAQCYLEAARELARTGPPSTSPGSSRVVGAIDLSGRSDQSAPRTQGENR